METKECPLCGEKLRMQVREESRTVPGTGQMHTKTTREWVCPECDYFEEVDE